MSARARLLPLLLGPLLAASPALARGRFGYRGWLWDPWVTEPFPPGPPTLVAPYGADVVPGLYFSGGYPPGVVPPGEYAPLPPVDVDGLPLEAERSVRRTVFSLTAYGQNVSGQGPAKGSAFGLRLGVEGEPWGVLGQWNGMSGSISEPVRRSLRPCHASDPRSAVSLPLYLIGPLGLEGQVSSPPTRSPSSTRLPGSTSGGDRSPCAAATTGPTSTIRASWTVFRTPSGTRVPWIGCGLAL